MQSPGTRKLSCGRYTLDLTTPVVMGVLNVTPDSFSDGGRFLAPAAALARARQMIEAGAGIVDVGGESTRPGAPAVSADEQCARVVPIVAELAAACEVPISVDTSDPEVMGAALSAGAAMINDVRALTRPGALEAAATGAAAICLMHMRGTPETMQAAPQYADVVGEICGFLVERVAACEAAGVARERLVVDPGFGFGKTLAHNLRLLAELGAVAALGLPVLVGLSRKSMLKPLTGRPVAARQAGSVALAALAVNAGAGIVRAHDVAATVDAVRVAAAVRDVRQNH